VQAGLAGLLPGENSLVSTEAARSSEQATERPRLLFFYGTTSGPSRRVEAFLSQVLQRRRNHETFRLLRVCAERHPELVEYFRVDQLPAIFVISGRQVQARVVAPRGRRELEQALAPWLN
jgi:thioredoxin-like negative regulator of GroEL